MHSTFRARFAIAYAVTALAVLSCTSGESTAPAKVPALPADSLPHLTIALPLNNRMTSGTSEQINLTATNVKRQSCSVTGPDWLGLQAGADPNSAWTTTPTAAGSAALQIRCSDYRNNAITAAGTLEVFAMPTVTPDISGSVPLILGDSVDISYDSTDTRTIDVSCQNCIPSGHTARTGPNTIRFYAQQVASDTLHRAVCFTVHGFDGRYSKAQCVGVAVVGGGVALYSVPQAIRNAELVPLHLLPVATYDGTGQSTHPDFQRITTAWSAGTCWMAYTPYANSNGLLENPSLATSPDCEHWTPAAGVRAPLVDKPVDGYNSDPELMYDAAGGCLGVVFRQVYSQNNILMTRSCDGKTWNAPRLLFSAPNHRAVSPTVSSGPDGVSRAWYVDAGSTGCSSTNNVVKMRVATSITSLDSVQFGPEVTTDLAQPGYVIWHMKVRYVPEKKTYIAMYVAFPQTTGVGVCTDDDLFVATSADGIHWHPFAAPVLNHLDKRFDFVTLYRASFTYSSNTDRLRVIVSGLEKDWGQYGVVYDFSALTGALNSSYTVTAAQLIPSPSLTRKAPARVFQAFVEDRP